MSMKFQGSDVVILRDARDGDLGFDAGNTDQVLVQMPDGTARVVLRREVSTVADRNVPVAQPVATTYQGLGAAVIRDAREGDPGYDVKHTDQVLILTADGVQKVVHRQEIISTTVQPAAAGWPPVSPVFEGEPVTVERDALEGDVGFNLNLRGTARSDQVLIRLADGTRRVVSKGDISAAAPSGPGTAHATFEGKPITIMRDAAAGDPGFVAGRPAQMLVKLADGTQRVIGRSDIADAPLPGHGAAGQATFEGKPATVLRDARDGDPGFVAGRLNQTLLRLADGTQRVVVRSDVAGNSAVPPQAGKMQAMAGGKPATVLRDARDGDPGFVAGKPNQVLIQPAGSNVPRVVAQGDITMVPAS